jgi:hypothetical protein
MEFLIYYLTLFAYRRFGTVWSTAGSHKEIAFGISITSGTLDVLILVERQFHQ